MSIRQTARLIPAAAETARSRSGPSVLLLFVQPTLAPLQVIPAAKHLDCKASFQFVETRGGRNKDQNIRRALRDRFGEASHDSGGLPMATLEYVVFVSLYFRERTVGSPSQQAGARSAGLAPQGGATPPVSSCNGRRALPSR
jgi:hypothetical protein